MKTVHESIDLTGFSDKGTTDLCILVSAQFARLSILLHC